METQGELRIKELLKSMLTQAEAEELGREVYAAVMTNDNYAAIVSLWDHNRAISVRSISGWLNFSLKRELSFKTSGEVERELRMKAREDQSK